MRICRICKATSNETKIYNNDLCRKHYLQFKRHGKFLSRTIYDLNEIIIEGNVGIIKLYNKNNEEIEQTIIDKEDIDKVKQYKWYLRINSISKTKYVMGTINGKKVFLHRFLLNVPKEKYIDHINRNTLDNRKINLRICTIAENSKNRVYKKVKDEVGVYQQYPNGRWYARICFNYKTIYLGVFDTKEEALKKRREAEKEYFKEYALVSQ